MNRGDVYQVRFDPTEGSEQSGTRPAVIVTRNSINQYSPVILVTPFTYKETGGYCYVNTGKN